MRAAVAVAQDVTAPFSGLTLTEWPEPVAPDGWVKIRVRAASLNPHDVWTLRGIGHPADRIPIVLGCDAAGVTEDGREVVVHPVMGDPNRGNGDITFDPQRALLSETINGGLAEYLVVPEANVVAKPDYLSFAEATTLGVTWGTAYRMLFTRAGVQAGDRVLVQGASGGVGSAAVRLASAAGARVYATARTPEKRAFALECGAHAVLEPGERLPERVDVVIETVGEATWSHSLRALRPGGTIVIAGATTGAMPPADLQRVFYQQLSIIGSTGSTRPEFETMLRFMETANIRPALEEISFDDIPAGFERLDRGDLLGKLVVTFPG